ncbi:MAG: thioredoxin family protein [Rhodoferax ferrireducens]|uniref:Thioredoxin family protein n=1 Tax=Rhodoferax ferrireducens TaxID=192843 RepID=A0A1W9KQJ6_9BURK|nr:MAG: thioredoxin family protein [Rhodoferax ferrireducens]
MAAIPPVCDFGWQAPSFNLPGVDGNTWQLADVRGERGTLVMFICNHCPYVQAILPRLISTAAELQALGLGVVAISSNDVAAYPEDSFEEMQALSARMRFPFAYLYDEDQSVARAWGAVCTPDFFGFNAAGELQYRGRFDASRKEAAPEGTPRDLFEAMRQITSTGQGPREQIASMGCSIKWKEA